MAETARVETLTTDVLYLAWNRLEFTRFSFRMLLENTDWTMVENLVVYDDGSSDGTRDLLHDMLEEFIPRAPDALNVELRTTVFGSPVAVMNDYVEKASSTRFAKIDNDIVVPPGWLETISAVMDDHPAVEIIGMESGRMGPPDARWKGKYRVEGARWIGGVGLITTAALGNRPRMTVNGRFGWTEWQREYRLNIGWIDPDLQITELSRIPFEPWASLSQQYREAEWEREWPKYHERWGHWYWSWWSDHGKVEE